MSTFYITNGVTQDGFGSRMQRCLQVMCFVYDLQSLGVPVEYLHTPFSYNSGSLIGEDPLEGLKIRSDFSLANPYPYNDIDVDGYMLRAKLWDEALLYNGKTILDIDITNLTIKEGINELLKDQSTKNTHNNLYVVKYMHMEYDHKFANIDNFDKQQTKIRNSFDSLKSVISNNKDIAIHIRRKDCIDKGNRYIDDSVYLNILEHLKKVKQDYNVTIYTQEVGFKAELYTGWNVSYDTQIDDYTVFKKMISANHLIVGGSSFSYAAGLLNPNTVVYHFNGHIPLTRWINYETYINLINQL